MATPTAKPAILCLHGSGSNSNIFNIQSIRIQRALSAQFTFVFPSAPFEVPAGPEILPTFEGCGPYYRWISDTGAETSAETRELLERVCEKQKRTDGRGFVGVMGFSQGCRVAAGLLLPHQAGKKHGQGEGLAFGVFAMGGGPPLTWGLSELEKKEQIDFPTLHLIGLTDPYQMRARKMYAENCDRDQAVMLEFDVGHRLPIVEQDTAKIVAEILRMHRETSGSEAEPRTAVA